MADDYCRNLCYQFRVRWLKNHVAFYPRFSDYLNRYIVTKEAKFFSFIHFV